MGGEHAVAEAKSEILGKVQVSIASAGRVAAPPENPVSFLVFLKKPTFPSDDRIWSVSMIGVSLCRWI